MFISYTDIRVNQKNRILLLFPYLLTLYKEYQLSYFVNSEKYDFSDKIVCLNEDLAIKQFIYYQVKCPRIWKLVGDIVHSNYMKRCRVKNRFLKMFDNTEFPVYFGTLTFRDNVLLETSVKTRRVYVRRFLKDISSDYLANIDFGDLNNREHYHCLFSCADVSKFDLWKYGFVNVKLVNFTSRSVSRISEYIVKLVNHCVKGSAGFLISSRKKRQ